MCWNNSKEKKNTLFTFPLSQTKLTDAKIDSKSKNCALLKILLYSKEQGAFMLKNTLKVTTKLGLFYSLPNTEFVEKR